VGEGVEGSVGVALCCASAPNPRPPTPNTHNHNTPSPTSTPIKPTHETQCTQNAELVQRAGPAAALPHAAAAPEITSQLYPHQTAALAWMIQRENSGGLPPFWCAGVLGEGLGGVGVGLGVVAAALVCHCCELQPQSLQSPLASITAHPPLKIEPRPCHREKKGAGQYVNRLTNTPTRDRPPPIR